MGSAYAVARVDAADLEGLAAFVAIHEEAAAWLWERGIRQWRPGEFTRESLARMLAAGGEVYLARAATGVPAGGFTLQWEDEEVWERQPPIAGYVHALCVRRADAGQSLGAALLDIAGQRVAAAGRPLLRLDCWKGNTALRAYYESLGFSYQGIGDSGVASLYQRPASQPIRSNLT